MSHLPEPVGSMPRSPIDPGERLYYPELDGLRFLAFVLVYAFHGGFTGISALIGRTAADAMRTNGWVGVQLFFILSGFLIATLLLREEERFGRISLRAFWMRRILRIWPLYYLTVVITFLIIPAIEGGASWRPMGDLYAKHLPAFLVFAGNWSMIVVGPVPYDAISILWSLCVEEQFYILAPLLLVAVPRRGRIPAVLALMASAVAVRYAVARAGRNHLAIHFNTAAQLDTLLSGVLLALVLRRWPPGPRAARVAGVLQWPLAAAIVFGLTRPDLGHATVARRTWDFVGIWACGLGVVAVAVVRPGWLRRALAYERLVWLGKISYGLYMYHEVALWARKAGEYRLPWFPNKEPLLTIAAFAGTIALAAASYYGFERPFLRLKGRWTRVPSRPV